MTTVPLSITFPDALLPRVLAALRFRWGPVDDGAGGQRPMTQQELLTTLQAVTASNFRAFVLQAEKDAAAQAAAGAVTPVDVT